MNLGLISEIHDYYMAVNLFKSEVIFYKYYYSNHNRTTFFLSDSSRSLL